MKVKPYPWPLRAISWLLLVVFTVQTTIPIGATAWAASAPERGSGTSRPPPPGVPPVQVKRLAASGPVSLAPRFSAEPTEAEIFQAHVFENALVPVGKPSTAENRPLAATLERYSQRANADDHSLLLDFLNQHPNSAWKPALLLNLGTVLRQDGYFSRAVAAWEEAWSLTKNATNLNARAVADSVLGELVQLHAWAGRNEKLDPLLAESESRQIVGGATEHISVARQTRWMVDHKTEEFYRCGPQALRQILSTTQTNADARKLFQARATKEGFSLDRLQQLADESGLKYQMAKRQPGGVIPAHSVIHWKFDHYGVIAREHAGKYLVQDTAFTHLYGPQIWVSKEALEEETDGYFLVPEGKLAAGWEPVTAAEGQKVFGRGGTPGPNKNATTPCDDKSCNTCSKGMAVASAHLMVVSLNLVDTPLWYTPPRGPAVEFRATYIQRDPYTAYNPNYSNLGVCWTFDWLSYITDNGTNGDRTIVTRYVDGGGKLTYVSNTPSLYQIDRRGDVLQYVVPDSTYPYGAYVLNQPDGSQYVFAQPSTINPGMRKVFLTAIKDSAGNALTLSYDTLGRISHVNDALGQTTTLNYSGNEYRIASVVDPFQRFAYFEYDTYGRLKKITDMGGLSSSFTYDSTARNFSFISQMTTPYGTSKFSTWESDLGIGYSRQLILTDPNGASEKILFSQALDPGDGPVPSVDGETWQTGLSMFRNTFYWDKKGYQMGNADLANATIYHWLHDSDNGAFLTSEILESVKRPLESRIWFLYPGQASASFTDGITLKQPRLIARVVDDPNNPGGYLTQSYKIEYNDRGKPTKITDPLNRETTLDYYANQLDLFKVRQTTGGTLNDVLAEYGNYDSRHRPSSYLDAARKTYALQWNAYGQLTQITNPKNEVTRHNYFTSVLATDPRYGQLQNIEQVWTGGTKATTFDYDNYRRVHTVTDSENYTVTYGYDDLDRLTTVTYPDLTYEQYEYARLDLVRSWDRAGQLTELTYDAVGHPLTVKDRLGQITHYNWCNCGGLESLTDARNQTTSWEYDVAGRVTKKIYANNTPSIPALQYAYETHSGKLKAITDAKNQVKNYSYNLDGTLQGVVYNSAVISTPSVSFTYDPNYRRLTGMTDGTGSTAFTYKPVTTGAGTLGARRLATVDGPLDNDTITYNYDELGRVTGRAINSVAETAVFDALGRVTNTVNPLGTFTPAYVNATRRLSSFTYPNNQVTTYGYTNNVGDQRLMQILNRTSSGGATISEFDYQYDGLGRIKQWTQQAGAATPQVMTPEYDREDQLLGALIAPQGQAVAKAYDYTYDPAGNRTTEQVETKGTSSTFAVTASTFNNVNQLNVRQGTGSRPVKFRGTVNEPATVTVNGLAAAMKQDPNSTSNGKIFTKTLTLPAGNNAVQVVATDFSTHATPPIGPNVTTQNYTLNVAAGEDRSYTYDANGNCTGYTSASGNRTYEWDAEDRLVAVVNGTLRSEFTYDGFSRRVKIVEKNNGTVTSTKQFVWIGKQMAEERDGNNAVTKRFYSEGQINYAPNAAAPLFYTRDHLGSVREVTDINGTVRARYDYDPYGRVTQTSGDLSSDFLFTGHYFHALSGLHLALYRAYEADTGRWLNRDPIEEEGGLKLYGYVGNSPIDEDDPLGLEHRNDPPEVIRYVPGTGGYDVGRVGELDFNPDPYTVLYLQLAADLAMLLIPGEGEVAAADAVNAVKAMQKCKAACFVAGTLIATENGLERIEDVKEGQRVWSFNEKTGETTLKAVSQTFTNTAEETIALQVGAETVRATTEHPFWVEDIGWTEACDLKIGDRVRTLCGDKSVLNIPRMKGTVPVYNFEVADCHSYFVGAAGVLVHNGIPGSKLFKKPKAGISGKEGATDIPSFAKGSRPKVGQNGRDFAEEVMEQQFGKDWRSGGSDRLSEFRKIQKYGDRNFE